MKTPAAKLILAGLLAATPLAQAQFHPAPNDRNAHLTLLTGPKLTSPATATGDVVPGQRWELKAGTRPGEPLHVGVTSIVPPSSSPGTFYFRQLSTPKPAPRGTLTLGRSPEPFAIAPNLPPLPNKVDPESLRFNSTLPRTEIRPLQKGPAAPQSDPK